MKKCSLGTMKANCLMNMMMQHSHCRTFSTEDFQTWTTTRNMPRENEKVMVVIDNAITEISGIPIEPMNVFELSVEDSSLASGGI